MINICLRFVFSCLVLCSGVSLYAQDKKEEPQGIEGMKAAEFIVEKWIQLPAGSDGIKIKDYEDKVLVMLFFQFTSEGSQDVALPKFKKLVDHYGGNSQVQFVAIQLAVNNILDNTPDKMQKTSDKFGLKGVPFGHYAVTASFPGMRYSYRVPHIPWFVVVGPDGVVKHNGVELSVEKSIENIDAMLKGGS